MLQSLPRWLKLTFKVGVAGILIGWIAASSDLHVLLAYVRGADLRWIAVALIVSFAHHLLGARRLQVLVRGRLPSARLLALTRDYFVGIFFNSFLVTSTGGDIVRAVYLSRYGLRLTDAASAVVVERVLGMVVLVAFPILGTAFGAGALPSNVRVAFFLGAAAIIVGSLLLLSSSVDRVILERLAQTPNRVLGKLVELVRAMNRFREPRRALLGAVWYSFLYQTATIFSVFALGRALTSDVGIATYFLLFPLVGLASMLPLTPNGTGVREGAIVLLFSQAGMERDAATALSLLLLGTIILQAIVGGVLFATIRGAVDVRGMVGVDGAKP